MPWTVIRSLAYRRRRVYCGARQSIALVGLAALIGATGVWLTESLIAPQASQAYRSRLDLFLTRDPDEPHSSLIRRAERAARTGAQRSFDQDLLTRELVVTVAVEGDGTSVPIMTLQVDREQWRSCPQPYYWAFYYRDNRGA